MLFLRSLSSIYTLNLVMENYNFYAVNQQNVNKINYGVLMQCFSSSLTMGKNYIFQRLHTTFFISSTIWHMVHCGISNSVWKCNSLTWSLHKKNVEMLKHAQLHQGACSFISRSQHQGNIPSPEKCTMQPAPLIPL